MSFIYILLLGVVQGLVSFLPVSSSGHLTVLEQLMGIGNFTGLPFEAFLYLGTLAAIFWDLKRDLNRLGLEFCRIVYDLLQNFRIYQDNRKNGRNTAYRRVIHNNYRKLVVLLLITTIPTMILGFVARNLAAAWGRGLIPPAIGFLLTGILLLVVDFIKKGSRIPRDMGYDNAMWIGICQGLSVFPGVSRLGLTYCAGLLGGMKSSLAVRYSILASVPAIIGAFLVECPKLGLGQFGIGMFFMFLAGTILAGFVGILVIRFTMRLAQKGKSRYFAYYNFVLGIAVLALYFLK